jgi:protein ATS1
MKLFAFGSNGSGQLGIGHEDDVSTPTQCLFETDPNANPECTSTSQTTNNNKITTIAAGGNHTLLLTTSGTLYAAGCNTDGRCGPRKPTSQAEDPDETNILRFRQVILSDPVSDTAVSVFKHVSATWEGTIAVASVPRFARNTSDEPDPKTEDRVFVFGSSPKGELGVGLENSSSPIKGSWIHSFPPENTKITALASGMAHAAVVLSDGSVYGWGAARKGQLGAENSAGKIAYSPVRIGIPFFAEDVACGREFTVISGRGRFVVLGDWGNRWGVLRVPSLLVGASGGLNLGLDEEEKGCGVCEGSIPYGYTGIGASWHGIYVHAAPGLERVEAMCSGSRAGGRSGSDSSSDSAAGSLVAWGRNDRGQLPPSDLPTPVKFAVGSEHALALLGDGRVAAFGWGEHGNCGPDTDSQGNVSGKYNVISHPEAVDGKVVGVGAGCATSWMILE